MVGVSFQVLMAGGPLASLSFVTSATVNASSAQPDTITAPAGILAGDLLVLVDIADIGSGTVTLVTPTGWSSAQSVGFGGGLAASAISYKIADGTESGTTITGINVASNTHNMMLAVFRGNVPINIVSVHSAAGQVTAGTPTNQVCTAGSGVAPLIVLSVYHSYTTGGAAITARGFSTTADGEITPNTKNYLDYKIYNASPADTTISMADFSSDNILQSCYLQCS